MTDYATNEFRATLGIYTDVWDALTPEQRTDMLDSVAAIITGLDWELNDGPTDRTEGTDFGVWFSWELSFPLEAWNQLGTGDRTKRQRALWNQTYAAFPGKVFSWGMTKPLNPDYLWNENGDDYLYDENGNRIPRPVPTED